MKGLFVKANSGLTLDETNLIEQIRQYGDDIFYDLNPSDSIDFQLSDSESNGQENKFTVVINTTAPKKKRKHFAANHYISPYSRCTTTRGETTDGHSHSSGRKIRKRIFSMYEEDRKLEQQKNALHQAKNKKYESIKSKYLKEEPILHNLSGYIEKNVYGRFKTETQFLRKQATVSREENNRKWSSFLKKTDEWEERRRNSLLKAQIQKNSAINQQLSKRASRKSPPKMSVEDCLHKLRRQTERLKQKLDEYKFQPVIYSTERDNYKRRKEEEKKKQLRPPVTILKNPAKELKFIL